MSTIPGDKAPPARPQMAGGEILTDIQYPKKRGYGCILSKDLKPASTVDPRRPKLIDSVSIS